MTAAVPELAAARASAREASTALTALDDELTVLTGVRAPGGVAEVALAVTAARAEAEAASAAVSLAEDREEKLRGELAGAGDESAVRLLLRAYDDRDRLTGEAETVRAAVSAAGAEHATAVAALAAARVDAERAEAELEAAFRAHEEAKATDLAVSLRVHLHAGAPCPVCTRPVAEVPAVPADSAVAAATAAGKAARAATKAAQATVQQRDAAARDLERVLVQARARQEQLDARLAELAGQLSGTAEPAVLRRELAEHARLRRALEEAATAVRAGRDTARRTRSGVDAAEERLRAAWRGSTPLATGWPGSARPRPIGTTSPPRGRR
ncbi:hypothetical protein GCM10027614_69540 [Micromonospora vulcania]